MRVNAPANGNLFEVETSGDEANFISNMPGWLQRGTILSFRTQGAWVKEKTAKGGWNDNHL